MIKLKEGVDVRGLHPKMWDAVYTIKPFFDNQNVDLVITSALDGQHSYGSLHYSGMAIDIRIRNIRHIKELSNLIKDILPSAYDVVLEETHIHIELQPKNQTERI